MTNKTILLVEDNPDDEALILRAFKKSNFNNEVIVARDGAEALDLLLGTQVSTEKNLDALPVVILLDLKLPKLDGHQVLQRLRADPRTKMIPVVMLTSSKEEQDIVSSYRLGANSYVCKPVDYDKLAQAISQLGLYWLALNELLPLTSK